MLEPRPQRRPPSSDARPAVIGSRSLAYVPHKGLRPTAGRRAPGIGYNKDSDQRLPGAGSAEYS